MVLALSLPTSPSRDLIVFMTYAVAVFSILVQGLTVPLLAKRAIAGAGPGPATEDEADTRGPGLPH